VCSGESDVTQREMWWKDELSGGGENRMKREN